MSAENPPMDEITGDRRKAIAESIETASIEEMKLLGERLFPLADDPLRERFFKFLDENVNSAFHHATTNDRLHFFYCDAKDKGLWFMPEFGLAPTEPVGEDVRAYAESKDRGMWFLPRGEMGLMQSGALKILKEIVATKNGPASNLEEP